MSGIVEKLLSAQTSPPSGSKPMAPNDGATPTVPPAAADVVAEYCKRLGGTKVIRKVLIANNGIGAVKAIRSIRRWAYETFGNERQIQFVVMATPDDLRINAEYIRLADEVVDVPAGTNNNNYANVSLIVDIAEQTGCDAVWPGWGHASENPRLPETLNETKAGIVFMGPNPRAMRDLGDKIGSTILAQTADVSCVAWSGTGVTVDYKKDGIPADVYRTACVTTAEEALACAEKIGYPIMIKASEGGGGKGIRKVTSPEGVPAAFRAVLGEVPGSPVFIMRLCPNARHLEVQLLADQHGNAIALFGRDCSVQRRHQKILEEGPVTAAPAETWLQMEKAAVRLAQLVNYCSAGTVEYLFDESGKFFFLELNPRLQVEHPVTEWISGVNLPAAQLHVAMGIRLDRIPMIRRFYSEDPDGTSPIDLACERRRPPHGHCIASRITAENPDEGFQPTSGQIQELNFRSNPNVWGYFSVSGRGGIHEYSDSQFGHLFAWGENRDAARKNLVCALKEISIHGEIRTPVEYLIKLLQMKNYAENAFHTQWLDGLISEKVCAERPDTTLAVLCGALQRAHKQAGQRAAEVQEALARGQVPSKLLVGVTSTVELIYDDVKYVFAAQQSGPHTFKLAANKTAVDAEVRPLSDGGLLVLLDGKSHVVYAREEVGGLRLLVDGRTAQFPREYDPSQLRSAMTGKLVRHLLEDGAHVKAGGPYAEIEVMKMYMPLVAPEAGRISYRKVEGSVLEAGDLIATLDLDDPSRVRRATEWKGALPATKPPRATGDKAHQRAREALHCARMVMAGYENRADAVAELVACLRDPALPLLEFREVLSVIAARVPPSVVEGVEAMLAAYEADVAAAGGKAVELRLAPLRAILEAAAAALPTKAEKDALAAQTKSLAELVAAYAQGLPGREAVALGTLLKDFIASELPFSAGKPEEDVVQALREEHAKELPRAADAIRSHAGLPRKTKVLLAAMEAMERGALEPHAAALHQLVTFAGRPYAEVAMRARSLLAALGNPSVDQRRERLIEALRAAAASGPPGQRAAGCQALVKINSGIFDLLVPLFASSDADIASAALEAFVRRTYFQYEIESVVPTFAKSGRPTKMEFQFLFTGASDTKQRGRAPVRRRGTLLFFRSLEELEANFAEALATYRTSLQLEAPQAGNPPAVNVLDVAIVYDPASTAAIPSEPFFVENLARIAKTHEVALRAAGVKMMTVIMDRLREYPAFYTFRETLGYGEDTILRHVLPAFSYELELKRLANFTVTKCNTADRHIHLYYAEEKVNRPAGRPSTGAAEEGPADADRRFFVRAIVRQASLFVGRTEAAVSIPEAEHVFLEGLKALEAASCDGRFKRTDQNHIFLDIRPDLPVSGDTLVAILKRMCNRYAARMIKDKVAAVEVRVAVAPLSHTNTHLRVVAANPTGLVFSAEGFREQLDPSTGTTTHTPLDPSSPPALMPTEPYPVLTAMERKRIAAQTNGTSYVYDFPALFEKALLDAWKLHSDQRLRMQPVRAAAEAWRSYSFRKKRANSKILDATELILGPDGSLVETARGPGKNDIGMVAWRIRLWTPEYPEEGGREIILIANDITFQAGAFSPKEDALFAKASELARREGLPRVYLAANSGARINLAQEVKACFRVEWNDASNPSKGYRYLYLTAADHDRLKAQSVVCEPVTVMGENGRSETRFKIVDIIGQEDGLGVECLSGSGLIAGETSRAYEETFTLTFVTSRSVGIGAYLVRLGQRVIQKTGTAPIILTGFQALNKVLGREVYTSNLQIGGPKVMYTNGVSHLTVPDDLSGVAAILQWLSYVPDRRGNPPPVLEPVDPIARPISFTPTKSSYDPRHAIAGAIDPLSGEWVPGLFDCGSWTETLGAWARTVITGRARLGGIPIGVVATEVRTVEFVKAADPANPGSQETVTQQAGQVWFPDSAYKTAQAIGDLNREGLPLFVIANWRGFSGGARDMLDEILKYGSYIVDQLRSYAQPVFVYIPPGGEVRGGAWVVIDSQINPEAIEMYADPEARGGVLEPQGICEIKFRKRDLQAAMARLDPRIRELNAELKADGTAPLTEARKKEIKALIEKREEELMPMYSQVAVQFADLHDTPGRMKAKGVIQQVVPWRQAREFFYWRLRRRLAERGVRNAIAQATPGMPYAEVTATLQKWLREREAAGAGPVNDPLAYDDPLDMQVAIGSENGSGTEDKGEAPAPPAAWADDRAVVDWIERERADIARRVRARTPLPTLPPPLETLSAGAAVGARGGPRGLPLAHRRRRRPPGPAGGAGDGGAGGAAPLGPPRRRRPAGGGRPGDGRPVPPRRLHGVLPPGLQLQLEPRRPRPDRHGRLQLLRRPLQLQLRPRPPARTCSAGSLFACFLRAAAGHRRPARP